MGHDSQDWEDPWSFLPLGGPPSGGNSDEVGHDGQVGLLATGRGNYGSGVGGGRYVHPPPPEYHRAVYCGSSDTGAMYGSGAASGNMSYTVVVGEGQTQLRQEDGRAAKRTGEVEAEGGRRVASELVH